MKNPNTPKTKKEVEAMRKKIKKLLWDNSYGDWNNGNLPEKVYKKYDEYPDFLADKILALLNPVEKRFPSNEEGCGRHFLQDFCDCGTPSPNEAPKCYCKYHDVPRNWKLTCSCNCQPPTPDKEWEEEIRKNNWDSRYGLTTLEKLIDDKGKVIGHRPKMVTVEMVINLIRSLLLSIDQEADRRVKETEKAYGGCRKCYGKGYATVRYGYSTAPDFAGDKEIVEPPKTHMSYCSCERGQQLKKLSSK